MDKMIGKLLSDRYEILEKIGDGGMATVYKARCRVLDRYVAIKILRPEYASDEEFIKKFNRESKAAASQFIIYRLSKLEAAILIIKLIYIHLV